ncbi:MAG: SDR family oxidoreductase [Proteobacteria bacterium]|nr:SDR family oxidoreductase [Pseudomonadota bacterium]
MKVLITGITGLMGGLLARHLLDEHPGYEVVGTHRWRSRMHAVEGIKRRLDLRECDVRDASSVRRLVAAVKPDRIFHLAAQSSVQASQHAPADTLATNVVGLVNLLEAVREHHPAARILVPGSSEEYGLQEDSAQAVVETSPLRPLSPYGVSKVTQDMLGLQYHESYKLHIVRTRAFNHTAPGREDVFVESSFARQIAEIEAGLREPVVRVGNLEVVRDYSDARDVARAYALALERCVSGEVYNICSERGVRIGEMLDMLASMSTARIEVVRDPERVREREAPVLVGSAARFRATTGWAPTIPLEQTLREILEYWRGQVRADQRALQATPSTGGER